MGNAGMFPAFDGNVATVVSTPPIAGPDQVGREVVDRRVGLLVAARSRPRRDSCCPACSSRRVKVKLGAGVGGEPPRQCRSTSDDRRIGDVVARRSRPAPASSARVVREPHDVLGARRRQQDVEAVVGGVEHGDVGFEVAVVVGRDGDVPVERAGVDRWRPPLGGTGPAVDPPGAVDERVVGGVGVSVAVVVGGHRQDRRGPPGGPSANRGSRSAGRPGRSGSGRPAWREYQSRPTSSAGSHLPSLS